ERSQKNFIHTTYLDPPRGVIYDRTGVIIASNEAFTDDKGDIRYRRAIKHPLAYSHVLGFVGRVSEKDIASDSHIEGISEIGKTGLEARYNDTLRGRPGRVDEELNATGAAVSRGVTSPAIEGENLKTTLHAGLQEALWERMSRTIEDRGFRGGAGMIFSVKTGEVLALVSAPSFDANAFARGLTADEAKRIFSDEHAPLFNRAISGAFLSGSIIKPFIALAALEENVIDPNRSVYSDGALELPDPFRPGEFSVFTDWKAHGYVDMRRALAVSSNVYFYTVGGGYGDIKGLGIERIKKWLGRFGIGTKTGIDIDGEKTGFLPDPTWKEIAHPENPIWRIGDTYHVSIGQGDLSVTIPEMARGLSVIANGGESPAFHIAKEKSVESGTFTVSIKEDSLRVVREGMRAAVADGGTAAALSWTPFPMAGKTGTAELGRKGRVNSWFMGYGPTDDPQIGAVIFLESGSRTNLIGASYVASETFRWIVDSGGLEALMR
ncbi:MAG: hypothetical protein HY470_00605, partial [Candidatus Ryanbacteria bacterium]|nr:hypothetical protein [Candidatus Ryanbacteria bacterium]